MTNIGWECPKCGACYAPTVAKCETCVGVAEAVGKPLPHVHDSGCGCFVQMPPFTSGGGVLPRIDSGARICGAWRGDFVGPPNWVGTVHVGEVLEQARGVMVTARLSTWEAPLRVDTATEVPV